MFAELEVFHVHTSHVKYANVSKLAFECSAKVSRLIFVGNSQKSLPLKSPFAPKIQRWTFRHHCERSTRKHLKLTFAKPSRSTDKCDKKQSDPQQLLKHQVHTLSTISTEYRCSLIVLMRSRRLISCSLRPSPCTEPMSPCQDLTCPRHAWLIMDTLFHLTQHVPPLLVCDTTVVAFQKAENTYM